MSWLSLKDLLQAKMKQSGLAPQVQATSVVEWFNAQREELIGPALAARVTALYVKNHILTLQCPSSIAMQEIKSREAMLVAAIGQRFGDEVQSIRFTVG